MDEERDDSAETTLIQAFADFVRSTKSGDRPTASAPEALLSITDAARYINVSVTTVRHLALGGKVRSTRVGDRIRFRRAWLDEWIDAGGGEVPAPPPAPTQPPPERVVSRPVVRSFRRRAEPKPKPPTFIQRIGDQELHLLADVGRYRHARVYTWHIGVLSPLCQATGNWASRLERYPAAYMCPTCLTALAAFPEADLTRFGVRHAYMLRQTHRGETATKIRAGYHSGDGRRTLCGKKDGPWALTERAPLAKKCFVCDHRTRWEARDLDRNIWTERPLTPLRLVIDVGTIDPRLLQVIQQHPQSLDARQVSEPLTQDVRWSFDRPQELHRRAQAMDHFSDPPAWAQPRSDWPIYMISGTPNVGMSTDLALERLPGWADEIDRAMVLYVKWSREPTGPKPKAARRGLL